MQLTCRTPPCPVGTRAEASGRFVITCGKGHSGGVLQPKWNGIRMVQTETRVGTTRTCAVRGCVGQPYPLSVYGPPLLFTNHNTFIYHKKIKLEIKDHSISLPFPFPACIPCFHRWRSSSSIFLLLFFYDLLVDSNLRIPAICQLSIMCNGCWCALVFQNINIKYMSDT